MSKGTILITGANGALGSKAALSIAKEYPGHYLLLTARNPSDINSQTASKALTDVDADFAWLELDLASFASVKALVEDIKTKVKDGQIKLEAIIHSAANQTFTLGQLTSDGFDPVYQINYLSPFLLTLGLLGVLDDNARIINVASSTHSMGEIDYFDKKAASTGKEPELRPIGLVEGLKYYGSSKLLLVMFGYELRRKLVAAGHPGIKVFSSDPSGMESESRLSKDQPWSMTVLKSVTFTLAPVIRLFSKSIINPPEVPAAALARLVCDPKFQSSEAGYYIYDKEVVSSATSRDEIKQKVLWEKTTDLLGLPRDLVL